MATTNCEPTVIDGNPKKDRLYKTESNRFLYGGQLKNPIPDEVKDLDELQESFKKWKIVPYAGTVEASGDATLGFYYKLSRLSETQAACKNSIAKYSFGGKIDIVRSDLDGFELGQENELDNTQKRSFVDLVLSNINIEEGSFQKLAKKLFSEKHETGNQWLEVILYEVNGKKFARLKSHPMYTVRYLRTEKGAQKFVYISPIWDSHFLSKNPPDLLPTYPAFVEDNGVLRTMIHIKSGLGNWYGKPFSLENPLPAYRELQDNMYLIKQADNNFTGQVIIEVEDDDPEYSEEDAQDAGFDSEADRMIENFTTQGSNPSTIMFMSRPYGSKPMAFQQVRPNTNENWYKVNFDLSSKKIIRLNNWSARLLDDDGATGLNSGDIFINALKKMLPVIRDHQNEVDTTINLALKAIIDYFELSEFEGFQIKNQSPYREILESTNEEPNNSNRGDQGNPSE